MRFGHASLLNAGECVRMRPECPTGCWRENRGDMCAEWRKLTAVTLAGGGTVDGDGESWCVHGTDRQDWHDDNHSTDTTPQ